MLSGPWSEGEMLRTQTHSEIAVKDRWAKDAFIIFMSVIHSRYSLVPRDVQFNTFLEIAKLADYYRCGEALDLAVERWIGYLYVPSAYDDSVIQWVFISLVFRLPKVFNKITRLIFEHGTSAVTSNDLPISESVLREYSMSLTWS